MEMTVDNLMAMIKSREVVLAEMIKKDDLPREVLKKEKKEKRKDDSRSSEELPSSRASDETHPLAKSPMDTIPSENSAVGKEPGDCQVEVEYDPAARTTSRTISGITAQHCNTKNGIKVSLTVQTIHDLADLSHTSLTAELKRHSRIRELKPYAGDSAEFAELYSNMLQELRDTTQEENGQGYCIGRVHERGARAEWLADLMVVGYLENGILQKLQLYFQDEYYEITMNAEMSPRQQANYLSNGIYGAITKTRKVPTLLTTRRIV